MGDDDLPDEDVETAWAAAAEAEFARLAELLAPLRVGLVHGRMRPADRDAEMARFRDGEPGRARRHHGGRGRRGRARRRR